MKRISSGLLICFFYLTIALYALNIMPIIASFITICMAVMVLLVVSDKNSYATYFFCFLAVFLSVVSILLSGHLGPLNVFICIVILNCSLVMPMQNKRFLFGIYFDKLLIIPFFIFFIGINMTNFIDGRMFGLVGDPNYTASILLTVVFIFHIWFGHLKSGRVAVFLSMLIVIALTASRMAMLAMLVFYIIKFFSYRYSLKATKLIAYLFFIFFTSAQFISSGLYKAYGDGVEWSEYSNDGNRVFVFADKSNLARINAFDSALGFIGEHKLIAHGIADYMKVNVKAQNIPHHWLLQLFLNVGILLSCVYIYSLVRFINRASLTILPPLIALFFIGSVLGKEPMIVGLYLVILSSVFNSDCRESSCLT